jgi:hypothetical protein
MCYSKSTEAEVFQVKSKLVTSYLMLLPFRIGQTSEIDKVFIKFNLKQTDDFSSNAVANLVKRSFLVNSKPIAIAIFLLVVGTTRPQRIEKF